MTFTLPAEILKIAQSKAQASGFRNLDDYMAHLVILDEEDDFDPDWSASIPDTQKFSNRAELEARLKEGIESGEPIEMTPERLRAVRDEAFRRADERRNRQP